MILHNGIPYGLALFLRIFTLSLAALGIVIQRKSHILNDNEPLESRKSALRRPLWHFGFWIYIFSSIISDIVGITSLPLLVIALVGTLLLFFNALYSHMILGEKMKMTGWIGTLLVAGASAGLAIILNVPSIPKTSDDLVNLVRSPVYMIYSICTCLCLMFLAFSIHWNIKRKKLLEYTAYANVEDESKIDISTHIVKCNFWIALLYMASSTIFASLALVFAKISYDLFQQSLHSQKDPFSDFISIVFLVITIISTVFQLVFFNFSLHYYPTLFTIPFGYSLGIVLACLNTIIHYDFFYIIKLWKSLMVSICIMSSIVGIYLLSRR